MKGDEAAQTELARLLPVVRYGAELAALDDYWKHATLLEIAVLSRDEGAAAEHLADAAARIREAFQPATTADNLDIIVKTAADPEAVGFVPPIIARLRERGS